MYYMETRDEIRHVLESLNPDKYRERRDAAIERARELGLTWREISQAVGITESMLVRRSKGRTYGAAKAD